VKRNSVLAIIVAIAVLISILTIPAIAGTINTFRIEGMVKLPGTDTAPSGGLLVTIHYESDKGTESSTDSYKQNIVVVLMRGAHEAGFYLDVPYTASSSMSPKFTLGYSIPEGTKYWEEGYYTSDGMKFYKEGQTQFSEGSISGLEFTLLRASEISGKIGLPKYTASGASTEVDIIAKTTGNAAYNYDDYEAKETVQITDSNVAYKLRVPANEGDTDYLVMYDTKAQGYEENGWFGDGSTILKASVATKFGADEGNHSGIDLKLIAETGEDPDDIDFDLNGDGKVDVGDMVLVARAMGSVNKFDEKYDLVDDGVIDVRDLKLIKEEVAKQKREIKSEMKKKPK
jgi:hypothetical protein